MHFVISALHFEWDTITGCLAQANAWGLDGVEFSWYSSFERPHCTHSDLADLAAMPVSPGALRSAHIWEDPTASEPGEFLSALEGWLEMCRRTHTTQLVLHGGTWPVYDAGLARLQRVLAQALPLCEAAGVTLNLENHYSYNYHDGHELMSTPGEFAAALANTSPALACCYDTGHGNMTHNGCDLIATMGRRLNYVHLADNMGIDDDHLEYGKGTVPWGEVFDALQAEMFDGVLCVEFPVRTDQAPFWACLAELHRRWPA